MFSSATTEKQAKFYFFVPSLQLVVMFTLKSCSRCVHISHKPTLYESDYGVIVDLEYKQVYFWDADTCFSSAQVLSEKWDTLPFSDSLRGPKEKILSLVYDHFKLKNIFEFFFKKKDKMWK